MVTAGVDRHGRWQVVMTQMQRHDVRSKEKKINRRKGKCMGVCVLVDLHEY